MGFVVGIAQLLVFSHVPYFRQGEDGTGGAGLGGAGFEFGVDPNEDPELALVSVCIFLYN